MKTLTSISSFALLPLLSLALSSPASAQVQLRETTELNDAGHYSQFLRLEGHIEGEPTRSYAFLVVGTKLFDSEILPAAGLQVLPQLLVALEEFKMDMARIQLPAVLPTGIFVQALIMSEDGREFRTSNWLELNSAVPIEVMGPLEEESDTIEGEPDAKEEEVEGEPKDQGGGDGSR